MDELKAALSLFSSALSAIKATKDLLPDSKEKEAASLSLEVAERAASLAEADIAKALGYQLCQCTFPPQIMLSKGDKESTEEFVCTLCKKSSIRPKQPPLNYKSDW